MELVNGVTYTRPKVTLLQETGIGVSEIAARTCYDSFDKSENGFIKYFSSDNESREFNDIEESKVLTNLAWVQHHHSILEHTNLSFLIEGTSRSVLQEHSRHRIQSISVRSTRYTMSGLLNAFISAQKLSDPYTDQPKVMFRKTIELLDMFVVTDKDYLAIEIDAIYDKLKWQLGKIGMEKFLDTTLSKEGIGIFNTYSDNLSPLGYKGLVGRLNIAKSKRNAGDTYKHIVSDNWKVDLVVTFNLRSLKNYFYLRDSGAAWFQIRWLAEEMQKVTPKKYLDLIVKTK